MLSNILKTFLFLLLALSISSNDIFAEERKMKKTILIGASIGERWDFKDLPNRINLENVSFVYLSHYEKNSFEKSLKIAAEGDSVILKLCAVNFRVYEEGDYDENFNTNKNQVISWVNTLKNHKIEPILATVVPITQDIPLYYKLRHYIKKYILFRDAKVYDRKSTLSLIGRFNDWQKTYAKENGLRVLDLESAVRVSDSSRELKDGFSTDGLHLNSAGYKALDQLANVFFKQDS